MPTGQERVAGIHKPGKPQQNGFIENLTAAQRRMLNETLLARSPLRARLPPSTPSFSPPAALHQLRPLPFTPPQLKYNSLIAERHSLTVNIMSSLMSPDH